MRYIINPGPILFCMLHLLAHISCLPTASDVTSLAAPPTDQVANVLIKEKRNAGENGGESDGDNEGDNNDNEGDNNDSGSDESGGKGAKREENVTPSPHPSNANAEFYDPNWTPLPNMVGAMRGYNILEGNPLQDSSDPGFVSQLFVPAAFNDKYGRMELQGGITANDLSTCKRSLSSESVTNMNGLKALTESNTKSGYDLQVGTDVEVSGGIKGADVSTTIPPPFQRAWGKSKVLKDLEQKFEEDEKMISISTGQCEKYEVLLDPSMLPPFTDMLKNGLVELSDANGDDKSDKEKEAAFKKFIEAYGTHYMIEVKMGAQIAATSEFSRIARDTLDRETLENCNYKAGSKIFGIQVEEDSNACSADDEKKLTNLGSENYKMTITSKGSRPTNMADWASQEFDPVPLKFKLAPIINLFRESLFVENKIQKKDQGGQLQAIAPKEILKWFLPIYWNEKKFCKVMKIKCIERPGCGLTDKCPADTFCDHTASKDKEQFCTSWTAWQCSAECGRGYLETRRRRCYGCIGSTYQEKSKMCKADRGCYTGKLKLTGNMGAADVPSITLNEIPDKIEEKVSVCALFKITERNGRDMVVVHLKKDKKTVMKLVINSDGQFQVFIADVNDQGGVLFENFPKNLQWQHVCLVWRHDWSIYGKLTLYLNGLFFEKRTVLVNRVSFTLETVTPGTITKEQTTPAPIIQDQTTIETQTDAKTVSSPIKSWVIIGSELSADSGSSSGKMDAFVGYISGVTIYNRVLTATNVHDAYEGYEPIGGAIFTWSQLMNAKMNSQDEDVKVIQENINPADVVRTDEDGDYYFESDDAVGQVVAEQACEQMGGFLTTIDSPAENDRLNEKMKKLKVDKLWIGLKSIDEGVTWKWSDNSNHELAKKDWSNWDDDVDFDNIGSEMCAFMASNGKWRPEGCETRLQYACLLNEVLLEFKRAEQSGDAGDELTANKAIDRDLTTFSMTASMSHPHWIAELVKPGTITRVHIIHLNINEGDQFEVQVSITGNAYMPCSQENKRLSLNENEIKLQCASRYRYVKVTIKEGYSTPLSLTLHEVFVYGRIPADEISFPNPKHGFADGEPYTQGYVEVKHNGVYGTICDTAFDNQAATVLCKMMGFNHGEYAEAYKQEQLAVERNKTVLLDNVECRNRPKRLGECTHSVWGVHDNCRAGKRPHKRDVGIRCFKSQNKKIRMENTISGKDDTGRFVQGLVEFKDNIADHYQFSSICGTLKDQYSEKAFNGISANALCRILGHKSGIEKIKLSTPRGVYFRKIATVKCIANGRLGDCNIDWDAANKCKPGVDVIHLRCYI